MKLISILVPSLITIGSLSLLPLRAIAFSVTQSSDRAALQSRLFGDAPQLNITQFDLGQIPAGFGLFQHDNFLGLGQGMVMSTGSIVQCVANGVIDRNCKKNGAVIVENLSGVNCADGVNPALNPPDPSCAARLNTTSKTGETVPGSDLNSDFNVVDPITGEEVSNPLDRIVLDILFNAERSGSLNFNYVFGSEEFPEFVPPNQSYASDIFRVMLADSNNQLRFNTYSSVASAAFKPNPIGNPNTPLDGYTDPIGVRIPFQQGRNRLIFTIEDVGDEGYDSTVFLQQISVESVQAQSVPTPPLMFGFAWMGFLRWRDRCKRR